MSDRYPRPMPASDIIDIVNKGGLAAFLLITLWAGWKGYWTWGKTYKECREREVEWKRIALKSLHVAEKATEGREDDGPHA